MRIRSLFVVLLTSLLGSQLAMAQAGATVKVSGEVNQPLQLTMAQLTNMKPATAVLKDRDGKEHSYRGVAVLDILQAAGVTTGQQLHGEHLAKYLLVKCADGYEVLFSLAELDPAFTDKQAILAYQLEGNALAAGKGPFRLVVPGEKRPARSCHQVVELVIRFAKD